ncbi:MAG: cyclodeaminase/cyclohydrolase family protein [Planctomycetota bacterium]
MNALADRRVDELLASIGAKTPAPGGGAVTGLVGAIAVALARMVVGYSVDSKKLADHREALTRAAERLDAHRESLVRLGDRDAEAYGRYNAMAKDDPARVEAARACIDVPLAVIRACVTLMGLYRDLAPISNRYLRSDLAIASILTEAAARGSMCNVRINLPLLDDDASADAAREEGESGLRECARLLPGVLGACA